MVIVKLEIGLLWSSKRGCREGAMLGGSMAERGGPRLGYHASGKRRGQRRAHREQSEASQRANEATDRSALIGRLI